MDSKSKRALEAQYFMGVASRMKGDTKTAEQCLTKVYMEAPGNFAASNQLAQVLVEENDPDKQERGLQIAVNNNLAAQGEGARREPARAVEAASTLGWAYFMTNRIPEADQATQAVINTGVSSPDIWYYRARLFDYHGQTQDAIKSLKAATSNTRGFFVHRREAVDLLAKLDHGHGSNASSGSSKTETTTPTPEPSTTPPASNSDTAPKSSTTDKATK